MKTLNYVRERQMNFSLSSVRNKYNAGEEKKNNKESLKAIKNSWPFD